MVRLLECYDPAADTEDRKPVLDSHGGDAGGGSYHPCFHLSNPVIASAQNPPIRIPAATPIQKVFQLSLKARIAAQNRLLHHLKAGLWC